MGGRDGSSEAPMPSPVVPAATGPEPEALQFRSQLRPAVLLLLRDQESHGYELMRRLVQLGVEVPSAAGGLYRTFAHHGPRRPAQLVLEHRRAWSRPASVRHHRTGRAVSRAVDAGIGQPGAHRTGHPQPLSDREVTHVSSAGPDTNGCPVCPPCLSGSWPREEMEGRPQHRNGQPTAGVTPPRRGHPRHRQAGRSGACPHSAGQLSTV